LRTDNLVWDRRGATYGMLLAVPGAVVIATGQVKPGVALVVGTVVAALVGVRPARAKRKAMLVVGLLFAASIVLGAILATEPWLAVPGIAVVAVVAAQVAAEKPLGILAMNLCLPIIGIGFSYDVGGALGFGLLILAGTIYGYLVSLAFEEYPAPPPRESRMLSKDDARGYGIVLALTGFTSALVGFTLNVDHVGWVVGAALLVIRPSRELQHLRSIGRVVSVYAGALLSAPLIVFGAADWVFVLVAPAALIGLAAMHTSRWYINAGFMTFLVIILLTYGESGSVRHFAVERTAETLIGVGIAYFFGLAVPKLLANDPPIPPAA
jgi:Fusaric acid resistance protein-like